jgi:hypothetical protein
MADVVNPQVVDDLTITNVKTIAGMPAQMSNMLLANMTSNQQRVDNAASAHQQAMQAIVQHTLTEAFGQRAGIDVSEAAGAAPLAGITDTLAASLAQALVKTAQTTPPVTTGI